MDGPTKVLGYSFGDGRPIAKVELRVDGGPWQPAEIAFNTPFDDLPPFVWVLWIFDWNAVLGDRTLEARATYTDGTNAVRRSSLSVSGGTIPIIPITVIPVPPVDGRAASPGRSGRRRRRRAATSGPRGARVTGPKLGANAPSAGNLVLTMGAGSSILIPHVTFEARVGLGASTSIELRYRNLGVLAHFGQARFTWATPVSSRLTFGLAVRTGIGTLGGDRGTTLGIDLSSLSLGNDWEVGQDMLLTWTRPHQAHVTWALGPTYALAGPRYTNYFEPEYKWDPRWQSVNASVTGEWEITESRRFFLRLDALFIVKAGVVPYGFLPTFTIGHAWST